VDYTGHCKLTDTPQRQDVDTSGFGEFNIDHRHRFPRLYGKNTLNATMSTTVCSLSLVILYVSGNVKYYICVSVELDMLTRAT